MGDAKGAIEMDEVDFFKSAFSIIFPVFTQPVKLFQQKKIIYMNCMFLC